MPTDQFPTENPFLTDFCTSVRLLYQSSLPGIVRQSSVQLQTSNHLVVQFGITHARKLDEIGIRWSGNEVTVDFLPGGPNCTPLCLKDNYSLRWISLNFSSPKLSANEKEDVETIVNNVYSLSQEYKPQLRFLIGHSAVIKVAGVRR